MGPRADTCGERKVHGAGREGGTVGRGEVAGQENMVGYGLTGPRRA